MTRFRKISMLLLCMFGCAWLNAQDVCIAAYNGDLETVKRLVEADPAQVKALNSSGRFPLEMAAQTGQTEIVRYLLGKGADVNQNRGGSTALHMAALYGGRTEVIRLLLEAGAQINARLGNGDTPLNMAVSGGQMEIAELLLDRGAEMNLENKNYSWLLYQAAAAGIQRVVDLVLQKEIDYSLRTASGATLMHAAAQGGIAKLADLLRSKEVAVGTPDIYGRTPIHIAAASGRLAMVEWLASAGTAIDDPDKSGKTPLQMARENGFEDVSGFLQGKGAKPSAWTFPRLSGPYLGQVPPGEKPALFAPGIVSHPDHFEHSSLAFAPDYSELYWSTDFKKKGFFDIVFMKREQGIWTKPKLASFSETYHAGSPVFSPDGKRLYFSSSRPRREGAGGSDANIWMVERSGTGWSEPKLLPETINTTQGESVQCVTREGTLYFRRETQMFRSRQEKGIFRSPEPFDLGLKSGERCLAIYVAPDERYMILEVMADRQADLFLRRRQGDGSWTEPLNLGPTVNSGGHERFPGISPDGKYLFFLRVFGGSDIYWIPTKIIEN